MLTNDHESTREARRSRWREQHGPMQLRIFGTAQAHRIREARCTIGAGVDNTVVLSDPYVSRRHCTIFRDGEAVWLEDHGSRNGTWINDVRVTRCVLPRRARLMVGSTQLWLQEEQTAFSAHGLVGAHPLMQNVRRLIERLSAIHQPILITGETGTGKELVARALHEESAARGGPFEVLNCGAIPRDLAEAELFGYAAGAFTGASADRLGVIARADGGTLFLDEIGEMPGELQPKFLRVLEEAIVRRLGDGKCRAVHFRLIAATHRDLRAEAAAGRFRLDLFHRLAVGLIQLPPLRERLCDIPALVQHFLAKSAVAIAPGALERLQNHGWPGNVRELRNAICRAQATCDDPLCLQEADFLFLEHDEAAARAADGQFVQWTGRSFRDIRGEIFQRAIARHNGNRAAAAMALGIPKSTFHDQVRELKLFDR